MGPPKPNNPQPQPQPQPWPLLQVRIGGGSGGDGRRFDGPTSGCVILSVNCDLFVQVPQTPDMQHSLPAQEIGEKLKHLMDLYKQMTARTASAEWYNNISFSRHFPGQFQNIPRPLNVESQWHNLHHIPSTALP